MPDERALSETEDQTGPDRVWLALSGVVVVIATLLRFWDLTLKPLHHDEGVNGFFLTNLVRDGLYHYDPANYHGPTLYYIAFAFIKIFGLNTWAIRASVAIFGVLTVVLVLYLRRYLGRTGTLLGALFVALSPGQVFISRYFIHEIFFVFLSLAIVLGVLFFIEKRSAGVGSIIWISLILLVCFLPSALNLAAYLGGGSEIAVWIFRVIFFALDVSLVVYIVGLLLAWDGGRPIYLILAAGSCALYFATKETAFITLGTMAIALGCIWIWRGLVEGELVRKNARNILIGVHILVLILLMVFRDAVVDTGSWFYTTFLDNYGKPPEHFVFYSLIILMAAAVAAWAAFLFSLRRADDDDAMIPVPITWTRFREHLGDSRSTLILTGLCAAIFVYLGVLFFSSFFTYAEGISKAFEAYTIWTKTGSKDHTQNGTLAYLKWGMKIEGPILIISTLGALISIVRGRNIVAMFISLWAFGLLLAYTLIPYKTPWLDLSFLLPMCLAGGYGLGQLITSKTAIANVLGIIIALAGTSVLAYQTYQQSFVRYDDDDMPYVYAHTRRGFLDLMNEVEHYADKSGKGKDATIEIVSPDYWPMTWYLKDYGHADFYGNLVDVNASEMIITKKNDQDVAALQKYGSHYKWVGVYPLRPGVNLVLLVRDDLADADAQDLYKLPEYKTVPGYTQ